MSGPRKLTDKDIADIREWHRQQQQLRAQIVTREQIAAQKGCSVFTVDEIVRNPDYRTKPDSLTECGVSPAEFRRLCST